MKNDGFLEDLDVCRGHTCVSVIIKILVTLRQPPDMEGKI
jgi:hypothetical protein